MDFDFWELFNVEQLGPAVIKVEQISSNGRYTCFMVSFRDRIIKYKGPRFESPYIYFDSVLDIEANIQ